MELNKQQQEVANHVYGPAVVLSAPGSGKTFTITERTVKLIEKGIPHNKLLCLTFTNKAAKEMRERIAKRLPKDKMQFFVGTFHSLCASILRRYGSKIGYTNSFTIFSQKDQEDMIVSVATHFGLNKKDIDVYSIMTNVNNWRENLENDAQLYSRFPKNPVHYDIAKRYLEDTKKQNIIDFSGLLYETVQLFKADSVLLSKFQEKWQFVQIDESQDTNYIQFYLVNQITEKHKNVVIIGDINQSIYKFRGSRYKNILDFIKNHKDCKQFTLGNNYRSTPEIIECADKLIKHNASNISGKMSTSNKNGSPVHCSSFEYPQEEAMWIANRIRDFVTQYGWAYSDCAILYRLNSLSLALQTAFSNQGIPFTVIGGPSFFDRREIRDCICMLKLLVNPNDKLAFHRIANLFSGVGAKSIAKIEKFATDNDENILSACKNIEKYTDNKTIIKACKKIGKVFGIDYNSMHAGDCIFHITDKMEYMNMLESLCPKDFEDRWLNVKELITSATYFGQKNKSVEKYLQNIALISSSDKESDGNSVSLMSIHGSKGLEFPVLFVVGVEMNILPHARAINEAKNPKEAIEEERRIFYVALTRAKKHLSVSYNENRRFRNKQGFLSSKPAFPSYFLDEAGLNKDKGEENARND